MSDPTSSEPNTATSGRAVDGRFAKGNPGGPGNPFARQTAALRAYLINHVTERDLQDILDILLLNAKGGHLPSIKFLFSYVLGKPKPVVEPDLLDLQEMQLLQQSALPPAALEALCGQLPLDLQVQCTRSTQADNAAAAVQTARDHVPAPLPPMPPSAPSTNGTYGAPRGPAAVGAPSPNGAYGTSTLASGEKPLSPNGDHRLPPPLTGFDWLGELRRALGGPATT